MKHLHLLLLALLCLCAPPPLLIQGSRAQMGHAITIASQDNPRRLLIGSVAPTCTYNECRGCRFKCRAEQVPVEGNDPINSAYHYKCVCHR
ncbi:EPIDERMAL PATTERNING FACTOR-like protein 9 [Salvia miltiorrhiza]|uniref:EPIDERMAL PATTERNING FACTOR-like protein 9 n=1 Tax=Salvia miltiorrhiza TaxID=226208 RepID=UPI0025AC85D1|nr:EPIDERMAL PATTERNING FACTOR-like protein 9 [Salvia miltiorrhiza]